MKKMIYIIIFTLLIIIDQVLKAVMINVNIEVFGDFLKFTYTENTGIAFSLGDIHIALILNILLILILVAYVIKNKESIKNFLPYFLVIAGGVSNLIDRIFRGIVIDYINVSLFNFPVFNLADIFVVIGIILIIINIIESSIRKV